MKNKTNIGIPPGERKPTKRDYDDAFRLLMDCANFDLEIPARFLVKIDAVANWLGDRAKGRKPDFK